MIIALSIRDFVLVRQLDLDSGNGFTALTGETGAGKSIILDALMMALGGKPEKRFVRRGAEQASVSVEFAVSAQHPIWDLLKIRGLVSGSEETLTCRRIIPAKGPARGFINDQPASAALLSEVGDSLIELHGQHAASTLLKTATHRHNLDQYGGCETLLGACRSAWKHLCELREERVALQSEADVSVEQEGWLAHTVEALETLSPKPDETRKLVDERVALLHSGRISEAVSEAWQALEETGVEVAVINASRAVERIMRVPGLENADGPVAGAARQSGEALERMLIEMHEAMGQLDTLAASVDHDGVALEKIETRLFALRAEARKHSVDPDALPELLFTLQQQLAASRAGQVGLGRCSQSGKKRSRNLACQG